MPVFGAHFWGSIPPRGDRQFHQGRTIVLSRRELEVARLVAVGFTNREIAQKLFIAERTADGHLEHIREKLGVRTRAQVATWVAREGDMSQLREPAVPNNLPRYLTGFVGREDELAALNAQIARSRMVTLTGAGGAGKTRLAVEFIGASLDRWPDGTWWVDLAGLDDPREVASAVSAALELPGQGLAQDMVTAWLRARRALIVMDNCEHLLDACARFCDEVLRRCPALSIIATSREALGLPGEAMWPVLPLRVGDAIRLFEQRAQLVNPRFEVGAVNLASVTEICRRLDGLPLAIELAAARIGMLTEAEILDQLSDRFRLLTSNSRTTRERQQGLAATIDWSYRLLTPGEAGLFRRLSVFKGGFTLESAQAICADGRDTVLAPLTGLVQKSMIEVLSTQGSATRYWLLESLAAYAAERLREEGDTDTRRRHYAYFSEALIGGTADDTEGLKVSLDWKRREWGNLQAALSWARDHAPDMGLALAVGAAYGLDDPAQTLKRLLDLLGRSAAAGAVRLKALSAAAWHAMNLGDLDTALSLAKTGVGLAREDGQLEELVEALNRAGTIQQKREDLADAAALFDEATSLLENSTNRRLINKIRNSQGMLAVVRGDPAVGRDLLTECVEQARFDDDPIGISYCLESLANATLALGDHKAAAAEWKESLRISREFNDHYNILLCLAGLSRVACADGEDRRALLIGAAAQRISEELSLKLDPWSSRQLDQAQLRSRARLSERQRKDALNRGWASGLNRTMAYALGERESASVTKASQ